MAGVEPLGSLQPAGFASSDDARELAASWRRLTRAALFVAVIWLFHGGSWVGTFGSSGHGAGRVLSNPQLWIQVVFVFFLYIANFAILFGPLLLMNMSQMRAFEPGDAE